MHGLGVLGALWGVLGVLASVVMGAVQLSRHAWDGLAAARGAGQIGFLLAVLAFFVYLKGYHGFQRRFAPRVVARALALARRPRALDAILAPLYCMGLFRASRVRVGLTWALFGFVVAMVVLLGRVPQPWRGLVDAGVVIGLLWGAAALAVHGLRALAGRPPGVSADLPGA